MNYVNCVNLLINKFELSRIASAYVEDSRRLSSDELRASLLKTQGQYTSFENIAAKLNALKLHENPKVRIIVPIILQNFLLDEDDYMSPCKATEEAIINYEQAVIDASNNFDYKNMSRDFALFKFILDKAWEHENHISPDEKNLIEQVRLYLNITSLEQNMLEAKSSRYPTTGNILHTRSDIDEVRRILQQCGLLFYIKNSDNVACDIIPDEIAKQLKQYYGIEIKEYGYNQLIDYVIKVKNKQYIIDIVNKHNDMPDLFKVDVPKNPTIQILKTIVLNAIKPSNLIGGYSPRDGFDSIELSKWCGTLGLAVSGKKPELIDRILTYYDSLRKIEISNEDERSKYYAVYHELANREYDFLRKNEIISKDLECEHYFEKATNYLFEVLLKNKPLLLTGSEHPDGKLSYLDKYVLWDNKSKETAVNLKDHIAQFDKYIRTSDKAVAIFLVIGPSFTENSVKECVSYALTSDTQICLITADELKEVAETWNKTHPDESFNLGYFKQNGRFNKSIVSY